MLGHDREAELGRQLAEIKSEASELASDLRRALEENGRLKRDLGVASAETVQRQDELGALLHAVEAERDEMRVALEAIDSEIVLEGQLKELVDAALHASEQNVPSSNSVIPCPNPKGCNWPACPPSCQWRPGRS